MSETTNDLESLWEDFVVQGLLPVGRTYIIIKDTNIKTKTNDKGETYKSMGVRYEILRHEDIPEDKFKPEFGWMNFYLRGKTVQRFRELYKGCTGRAVAPTGRDEATGKPTINYEILLNEINGLGCWTAYVWRKNKDSQEMSGGPGWSFAQNIEAISKPQNPFTKNEEEAEEGEDE